MKDSIWKRVIEPFKDYKEYFRVSAILIVAMLLIRISGDIAMKVLYQYIPDMRGMTEAQIDVISAQASSIATVMGLTGILLFIIIVAIWTLATSLIFTRLLKKKLTQKYFFSFYGLNIILFIIIGIITAIFGSLIMGSIELFYLFYVVLYLFLYYSIVNYIQITKKPKILLSISKTIINLKLKSMVIVFLMMIVFAIIIRITQTITVSIIGYPSNILTSILSNLYVAWACIYMVRE